MKKYCISCSLLYFLTVSFVCTTASSTATKEEDSLLSFTSVLKWAESLTELPKESDLDDDDDNFNNCDGNTFRYIIKPPQFIHIFHEALNNYGHEEKLIGPASEWKISTPLEKDYFSAPSFDPNTFLVSIKDLLKQIKRKLRKTKSIAIRKMLSARREQLYEQIIRLIAFEYQKRSNTDLIRYTQFCLLHHTHDIFLPSITLFFEHMPTHMQLGKLLQEEAQRNKANKIQRLLKKLLRKKPAKIQPIPLHKNKIPQKIIDDYKYFFAPLPQKIQSEISQQETSLALKKIHENFKKYQSL